MTKRVTVAEWQYTNEQAAADVQPTRLDVLLADMVKADDAQHLVRAFPMPGRQPDDVGLAPPNPLWVTAFNTVLTDEQKKTLEKRFLQGADGNAQPAKGGALRWAETDLTFVSIRVDTNGNRKLLATAGADTNEYVTVRDVFKGYRLVNVGGQAVEGSPTLLDLNLVGASPLHVASFAEDLQKAMRAAYKDEGLKVTAQNVTLPEVPATPKPD